MKTFFATLFAVAAADYHHVEYSAETSADHHIDIPTGDYWNQVDEFDAWKEIRDQHDYEERLDTEAELMIALEALREALVQIDADIDDLDDCISHNDDDISENDHGVEHNDHEIHDNDSEISDQESRVKDL